MAKLAKTYKKVIGERIRARRISLGFHTQTDFGDAVEADQGRVSKWESGSEYPDEPYRKRICKVLKTTELELFGVDPGQSKPLPVEPSIKDAVSILGSFQKATPERRAIALFFLTGDASHLETVPDLAPALEALAQAK